MSSTGLPVPSFHASVLLLYQVNQPKLLIPEATNLRTLYSIIPINPIRNVKNDPGAILLKTNELKENEMEQVSGGNFFSCGRWIQRV